MGAYSVRFVTRDSYGFCPTIDISNAVSRQDCKLTRDNKLWEAKYSAKVDRIIRRGREVPAELTLIIEAAKVIPLELNAYPPEGGTRSR
jgi:hypothetical protein